MGRMCGGGVESGLESGRVRRILGCRGSASDVCGCARVLCVTAASGGVAWVARNFDVGKDGWEGGLAMTQPLRR